MPKSVRLDTSNSGCKVLVKGSIGVEGKTPDGHITAIVEILEGDEVVYTCLVVGTVSDISGIYLLYSIKYITVLTLCM